MNYKMNRKEGIRRFLKHNAKKIISAVLLIVIITTWYMADFTVVADEIERVITEWNNDALYDNSFDYAVFAGDENNTFCINAGSIKVNGDVHTNKGFLYHGNTIEISGVLESANYVQISTSDANYMDKIGEIKENTEIVENIDLSEAIIAEIENDATICNGYASYCSTGIYNDTLVYGDAGIFASDFHGDCVFMATGNIQFGVESLSSSDGGRVFLGSQNGNITINASNTRLDGIIYAPNGTVMITGENVHINGRIIAKQIYFYGSNLTVNATPDDLSILDCLNSNTELHIDCPETAKENSRVKLCLEDNTNSKKWNQDAIDYAVYKINGESVNSATEGEDYLFMKGSDSLNPEVVFLQSGNYEIKASVVYKDVTYEGSKTIIVTEDLEPEVSISVEDFYLRDKSGSAEITIHDHSYSLDGDQITYRKHVVYYDQNNDGMYDASEIVYNQTENEEEVVYHTKDVGNYKIFTWVCEAYDEEVYNAVGDGVLRTSSCVSSFEVGNVAPEVQESITRVTEADIIYLYGSENNALAMAELALIEEALVSESVSYVREDICVEEENAVEELDLLQNIMDKHNIEKGNIYVIYDKNIVEGYSDQELAQFEKILAEPGAIYAQYNESSEQGTYVNWILKGENTNTSEIGESLIVGSNVEYFGAYQDYENDPLYKVEYTYSITNGNENEINVVDAPINTFTKLGNYDITVKVQDNPVGNNDAYAEYRLWSQEYKICEGLTVCQRPVCDYEAELVRDDENPEIWHANVKNNSLDSYSSTLMEIEYSYKKAGELQWKAGSLPENLYAGEVYLLRGEVQDTYGNISLPKVEIVCIPTSVPEIEEEATISVKPSVEVLLLTDDANSLNDEYYTMLKEYKTKYEDLGYSYEYSSSHFFDDDFRMYNGHYYYIPPTQVSWVKARQICEDMNGHLVTISSEGENEFIKVYAQEVGRAGYLAIGFHDSNVEGIFEWVTGEPLVYTFWGYKEPNSGLRVWEQDYAYMNYNGDWDDGYNYNDHEYFACEWDSEEDFIAGRDGVFEALKDKQGGTKIILTDLDQMNYAEDVQGFWEKKMYETGADIYMISNEDDLSAVMDMLLSDNSATEKECYVGDELVCKDTREEVVPEEGTTWQFITEYADFYGNNSSNMISDALPVLDKAGVYTISWVEYQNTDGTITENILIEGEQIEVHDRPVATIDSNAWKDHVNPGVAYTELHYDAYSDVWKHEQNGGIQDYIFAYKKVGETEWTEGPLPETVDLETVYLARLQASDVKGILSYPAICYVSTKGLEFPDITKPEIKITLSSNPTIPGDEVVIDFAVTDDRELSEYALYIDGEVLGTENGTYTFVPEAIGTYVISGYAKDSSGNENTVNVVLDVVAEIIEDTKAPLVEITEIKNNQSNPEILEFYGTVKDETALYEYRLSGFGAEDTTNHVIVASGNENIENALLGSIDLSTLPEGSYEFTLYAKDMAGNECSDSVSFTNAVLSLEYESVLLDSENGCIIVTGHILEGGGNASATYTCVENSTGMQVNVETVGYDEVLCKIQETDLVTGKYTLTGVVTDQYNNSISAYAIFDYTAGVVTEAETEVEETRIVYVWDDVAFNEDHSAIIIKGTKSGEITPSYTCVNVETGEEYALEVSEVDHTSTLTLSTQNLVTGTYKVSAIDPVSGEVIAGITFNYDKIITEESTEEEYIEEKITKTEGISIAVTDVAPDEVGENILVKGSITGGIEPVTVWVECTNAETGTIVTGEQAEDITSGILAKIPVAGMADGIYEMKITVTDADGNPITVDGSFRYVAAKSGGGSATMGQSGSGESFPYDETDVTPPTGQFYLDTTEVYLKDATDVVATLSDDKEIYKYVLEYRLKGNEEYILLAEGNEAVSDEVIAVFDPTLLKDGVYELRLSVYDFGGFCTSAVSEYTVAGGMKVGNMFIGFTDVAAQIYDMSLNVNRYYSSINKESGDFGVGWNLELQGMYLQPGNDLTAGYETKVIGEELSTTFSIEETVNHDIILYFGDGSSERFELSLSPASQHLKPIDHVTVGFRCADNPNVKLEIVGNAGAQYFDSYLWWDDESNYSGIQYKYTDANEVAYYFDANGTLTAIENEYGDKILVTNKGYEFEDGSSIIIARDELGRVTSITDREGKICIYEYDSNNNLIRYTDAVGNVVSYTYDINHNLLAILDESGKVVARSEYNEQGRLIATIDAEGNRIEYDYDPEAGMQSVRDRRGNVTVYYYDGQGNVTKEVDPYGNTTLREFDENGNITRLVDKCNNEMKYTYDSQGNMTGVEFPNGLRVSNTYDTSNRPVGICLGDSIDMSIAYDDRGNVTETVDGNGNTVTYSYDANGMLSGISDEIGTIQNTVYREDGQPISVVNATGTTFLYQYDAEGLCTSIQVQSPDGATLYTFTYTYDERQNLSSVTDTLGNVQTFETDTNGNILAKTDALGNRTEYTYDIQSNLVKVRYADGTSERFTYDGEGNVTSSVNRLGQTVTMEYDKLNRLVEIAYPDGTKESYTYDAEGNVLTHTSVTGVVTTYTYDCTYQVTSVIDGAGGEVTYTYDELGRVHTVQDCLGNITTYEYDDNNNVTAIVYPDNTRVTMEYDARNRLKVQKDAYGNATTYTYDNGDYLTAVTNRLGAKTVYEYDCFGNLILVKDARGNSTAYTYDELSRVTSVTNPLGDACTYEYDANGNVIRSTDWGGNTSTYVYDSMGRLIQTGLGEETVSYTYQNGLLTAVTDASGMVKYQYDTYGRLISETDPFGNEIRYTYDVYGRVESLTSGEVSISYTYDNLDRISCVTDAYGNITTYTYDAMSRVTGIKHANGMETRYTYDVCGQVISETVTNKDGNTILAYSYTHGLNGELLTVEETEGNTVTKVSYRYDKEMRLTGETRSQGVNSLDITYAYDAVGNRTSKTTTVTGDISGMVNETVTEGSITYTYNAWNQLVSEKHNGNTSDYTYDKSGAISGIQGDTDITYIYDAKGRLTRYTTKENGITATTEYTYDYRGTRTSKTVDGKETRYITYSMNGLSYVLYETDSLGNITTEYVRGHQLHTMTRDGATYVYLSDAHMDVRALADTEGNIVNRYRYDAWGNTLYAEETVENTYRYCQEAYDAESGNTYLRARYYSATTANFLSADAYAGELNNPMTLNKYAYAGANPVMYADPSGYAFTTFELSIRAAMESILIHMPQINLMGILCGGLSAIDTALSGEGDVVESFFIGYGVGIAGASLICGVMAIPAIMLEVKMMLAVVQSVSIGFGIQLAGEAWEEGNVPLAVFRSIMVTADIATFYMQFGPEIANGWRYYFGNTGGQSTASAAARVTSGHEGGSSSWVRNLDNTSDLNVDDFLLLKDNGVVKVNTSGSDRPLTGAPNSYYKTGNGEHIFVYDGDGKLIYDISSSRVKGFKINVDPNGIEHYQAYKLEGAVPDTIKEIFGW